MTTCTGRMRIWVGFIAVLAGLMVAGTTWGQATRSRTRTTTRPAATRPVTAAQQLRINIAWQVALDAVHFSPGIVDGHFGRKGQLALGEYAARFFPGTPMFDRQVYEALGVDVEHAVGPYTITAADAATVGPLPTDWNDRDKSKIDRMPYETLADGLAEKFHCTQGLLGSLNPGVDMQKLTVGQELQVPHVRPFPGEEEKPAATTSGPSTTTGRHAKVEGAYASINLTEKTIRVYDAADKQLALFHCSVAKDKAKLPARDTTIVKMAMNPEYTFDPKHWPEVTNVDHILTIPPGPRNPVGVVWIGLDLPGYGIHGNPKPELIGKTGSHGCFRMTNWDATAFYGLVRMGLPIEIVNPEKE